MANSYIKTKLTDINNMPSKKEYEKQLNENIIAVDFDDTITEVRPYPQRAPLNKDAKKYLDKLHEQGFTIVLWSSRMETDYNEAYDRCINEFNMPYIIKDNKQLVHGSTGKLLAKFYIDDKSYLGKRINWKKIYRYISNHIV